MDMEKVRCPMPEIDANAGTRVPDVYSTSIPSTIVFIEFLALFERLESFSLEGEKD